MKQQPQTIHQYDSIINDILKIGYEEKFEDYWKDNALAPILCKHPITHYQGEEVPLDDVIPLRIDTRSAQQRNPTNMLICGSTGCGKTQIVKNYIRATYKQGYRILFIEPKSVEMMNATKKGTATFLAPHDFNDKLPVVSYYPNYTKFYMKKNYPQLMSKIDGFYSHDISKLDTPEIWQSFGMPEKISTIIKGCIEKGFNDLQKIKKEIMSSKHHPSTFQAIDSTFASLEASNFFGSKHVLPLEEEWNKGNIVRLGYSSKSGVMMNTDIGIVLDLVKDIGQRESSRGLQHVTKKLLVFDDAFYYAGLGAAVAVKNSKAPNFAAINIMNCQNNFRTWGIDTIFIVQSPDSNAVLPSLIDGCTSKLITYTENPKAFIGKIPPYAVSMLLGNNPHVRALSVNEEQFIYEWIHVIGKTRIQHGFPFQCSVGHSM